MYINIVTFIYLYLYIYICVWVCECLSKKYGTISLSRSTSLALSGSCALLFFTSSAAAVENGEEHLCSNPACLRGLVPVTESSSSVGRSGCFGDEDG